MVGGLPCATSRTSKRVGGADEEERGYALCGFFCFFFVVAVACFLIAVDAVVVVAVHVRVLDKVNLNILPFIQDVYESPWIIFYRPSHMNAAGTHELIDMR